MSRNDNKLKCPRCALCPYDPIHIILECTALLDIQRLLVEQINRKVHNFEDLTDVEKVLFCIMDDEKTAKIVAIQVKYALSLTYAD